MLDFCKNMMLPKIKTAATARAIQIHFGRLHGGECFSGSFQRDRPCADPLLYLCLPHAASRSSISKDEDRRSRCDSVLERDRCSVDMVAGKWAAIEGIWMRVSLPWEETEVSATPWPAHGGFSQAAPWDRISTTLGAQRP